MTSIFEKYEKGKLVERTEIEGPTIEPPKPMKKWWEIWK
jgi:hypothetical protein